MSRSLFAFFFILSFCAESFAQHIPPCQSSAHSGPICYGYATGRAFGRTWSSSSCPLSTLYLGTVPSTYFDFYSWNAANVAVGDVIKFGSSHAAYVTASGGTVETITVAQYSTYNGQEETGVSLQQAINDYESPTDICRKKPLWQATVQNNFSGGKVNVNGGDEEDSPHTTGLFLWGTTISIDAVMDGRTHENYVRRFQEWQRGGSFYNASKATTSTLTFYNYTQPLNHTAYLNREFNITFQNSLPGAGGGQIKVGGTTYNGPKTVQLVEQSPLQSVTGEALYQIINNIVYTFNQWNDASTTNPRTFTPGDHATYTANFTPKPFPPENISVGGQVGNPVQISWTMHPSTYVTEYQIWRKIKPKYGQDGNPVLLATLGRTTTSYTDWDYYVTSGYTDDLVYYDVRSHFVCSPWNLYSDMNWSGGIFGTDYGRRPDGGDLSISANRIPSEFSIGSYPNPFNPSTTISYQLVEDAEVTLEIFDLMGRKVASVVEGKKTAGYHSVLWFAKDGAGVALASGIYFYRFIARPMSGNEAIYRSGKLALMK